MNAFIRHLNKNKIIYIIILLFFIIKLFTISTYKVVWWDSAVYIGMGKYIYSSGDAGFWEYTRPVVWPLILGFFWKIGMNHILIGRLIEIVFGSLCILLTYLIGKKIFNEKIALLSSVFLAVSPTFFFFNGIMLTETASTFFALVAVYYFINKNHFVSGAFFALAFMTRYLQLFAFFSLFLVILIYNKKNIENLKKISLGFLIFLSPFLLLYMILYNNPIFPFIQQFYLSKNSGWLNHQPLSFYFIELFKENILYLLFIPGLLLVFRSKDTNKKFMAITFILFFSFFILIKQKEMRFLIVLFPYMYLLASCSIFYFLDYFKSKIIRTALTAAIAVSFMLSFTTAYAYYNNESDKINEYAVLQDKIGKINVDAKIWISSPVIAAFSDKKIDNLMYYPVFNEKKVTELLSDNADFILLDSCDLSCKPFDVGCEKNKDELISNFKNRLKTAYLFKGNSCEQFVFAK